MSFECNLLICIAFFTFYVIYFTFLVNLYNLSIFFLVVFTIWSILYTRISWEIQFFKKSVRCKKYLKFFANLKCDEYHILKRVKNATVFWPGAKWKHCFSPSWTDVKNRTRICKNCYIWQQFVKIVMWRICKNCYKFTRKKKL